MPFLIDADSPSKTESERIALKETMAAGSALHNASTGEESEITAPSVAKTPQLAEGHTQDQQDVIDYAWEVSNGDMRFIYLLTGENGEYSFTRRHNPSNNSVGVDWGLCGINDYYHKNIIQDSRFLTDREWQTRKCYELYTSGTTFYGIKRYDRDANYRQKIHNKFAQ